MKAPTNRLHWWVAWCVFSNFTATSEKTVIEASSWKTEGRNWRHLADTFCDSEYYYYCSMLLKRLNPSEVVMDKPSQVHQGFSTLSCFEAIRGNKEFKLILLFNCIHLRTNFLYRTEQDYLNRSWETGLVSPQIFPGLTRSLLTFKAKESLGRDRWKATQTNIPRKLALYAVVVTDSNCRM